MIDEPKRWQQIDCEQCGKTIGFVPLNDWSWVYTLCPVCKEELID